VPGRKKDDSIHIDLAAEIVKVLFDENLTRTLNYYVPTLFLSMTSSQVRVRKLYVSS